MVPLLKDQVQKTDYLTKLTFIALLYFRGAASAVMANKNI